ncbi:MAG TPA: sodium:proton antiporter [Steroidobacteraceae bacterium]
MIATSLSQLGILLFVATLVAIVTRRLRMPYTVGLVLAGMALSLAHVGLPLRLSKDLIFLVFLPPLVFEAALFIRWREFKKELPVVGLLATLGVALAGAVTAAGMHYLLRWDWASAIVFGILISATDPVSVIATFKESGVHGRLRLLMESESLLNDGTAAVVFVAALAAIAGQQVGILAAGSALLLSIGGGISIGVVVAFGFILIAGQTADRLVEVALTTLTAYGSFFVAEHFQASGVMAALSAGLVVGHYRTAAAISEAGFHALETFWEYAAFIANSFIFLLIGVQEAQQHFQGLRRAALIAIVLVTLGRAVSIYPVCAVFVRTRLRVPLRDQHVLVWGGLRGALALALALALPDELPQHDAIVTVTFAVVAFSVFVQGLTMTPLLRRLGNLR